MVASLSHQGMAIANARMARGSRTTVFVLGLAVAMLLGVSARANLLTNGGFEADFDIGNPSNVYCTGCADGGITGWTTTGDAFSTHDGVSNTGQMDASIGVGTLSQGVTTVPGQQYIVTFYLATDSSTVNGSSDDNLDVSFPNSVAGDLLDIDLSMVPNGFADLSTYKPDTYLAFSYTVTATNAITAITFTGDNLDGLWHVDDVSIEPVPAAIPEPTPLALLLSALLGLGAFEFFRHARRRSGRAALTP